MRSWANIPEPTYFKILSMSIKKELIFSTIKTGNISWILLTLLMLLKNSLMMPLRIDVKNIKIME